MRVIVTGSREWKESSPVYHTLGGVQQLASAMNQKLIVVHGDASRGVDDMVNEWYEDQYPLLGTDILLERHPANWKTGGKGAGLFRNQHMANLGADMCLAFRLNMSPGTSDMIRCAKEAGIPTYILDRSTSDFRV